MAKELTYLLESSWTGNTGQGTLDYKSYTRDLTIRASGKPDLLMSADPLFLGDKSRWNPEELLVSSLSSCHMLSFLHVATTKKIVVLSYTDKAEGEMIIEGGKGFFKKVTLNPQVHISDPSRANELKELHEMAHHSCFIANSVNFEVKVNA